MTARYFSYLLITVSLASLSGCGDKHGKKGEVVSPPNVKVAASAAESFSEIIEKSNCLACHRMGNQMGAPSWSDVAERYKKDNKAEKFLENKISQGGSGSWGSMDMPPYYELSNPELKIIVQGLLAYNTAKPVTSEIIAQRKVTTKKK